MEQEIIDAIMNLNDAFFKDADTPINFMGFAFHSNGYSNAVLFMGEYIWSDDDDTRIVDEPDTYESYYDCFLREALKINADLQLAIQNLLNNKND